MSMLFIDGRTLSLLIPIVAIIVGGLVIVVKAILRHQERIAMIERGMHPDRSDDDDLT